VSGVLY